MCCELLSELYFYTAFTGLLLFAILAILLWIAFRIVFLYSIHRLMRELMQGLELWIAFRIVFLYSIHRSDQTLHPPFFVVNCFQNCIFIQHSQDTAIALKDYHSCELLSELYFYTAFTGLPLGSGENCLLWIAFRIVFLYSIHRIPAVKSWYPVF